MVSWPRRGRPHPTPTLTRSDVERLGLARQDRVLAMLEAPSSDLRLVITQHQLVLLPDVGTPVARPWHLVDRGAWSREDDALTVTWVDGSAAWRFALPEPDATALAALRERVQASVITHHDVKVHGGRGSVRVVVRNDLATREVLVQTLYGQGVTPSDPAVERAVAAATAELRDAVGLPPQD